MHEAWTFTIWYLIVGAVFLTMAVLRTHMKRLPLTGTMLYLGIGMLLGPMGGRMIQLNPRDWTVLIERLAELAVIVSLFTAGLKLRVPLTLDRWQVPLRLAFVSMALTVGMITLVGVVFLQLPLGVAVLLGAILAPTDPVLASEVQQAHPFDKDRLRYSLTGEAGFNDGTAFPFVMLGLGLLGLHEGGLGAWGWRWIAVDVIYRVVVGLAIGALAGFLVGRFITYLRSKHREAVGTDDFLALGLLASAYGAALLVHSYGFLAAFAAGVALRAVEMKSNPHSQADSAADVPEQEEPVDPAKAPAVMARAVLQFNEQLERTLEVTMVLLLGGMLLPNYIEPDTLWFVPVLFLVIRPIAVMVGLWRTRVTPLQSGLMCWFGIRGIGSIYYLMHAINHGIAPEHARALITITFTIVAASIILHGMSVSPLMKFYERRTRPDKQRISGDARAAGP